MSSPFPHAFRQCIGADSGRDYVGLLSYEVYMRGWFKCRSYQAAPALVCCYRLQDSFCGAALSMQISAEKLESAVTQSVYNFHVSAPSWHRPTYGGQAAACIVHRPWTDKLADDYWQLRNFCLRHPSYPRGQ